MTELEKAWRRALEKFQRAKPEEKEAARAAEAEAWKSYRREIQQRLAELTRQETMQ